MRRFNSIAIIVAMTAALARAAEPTYVIHFDEADRKGDRATFERVSATIVHSSSKFDDQEKRQEFETTIGMQLRGDWEVLDADEAAANSTAESMTVRSWTRKVEHDGKVISDKSVLPPGTKVVARLKGEETKYAIRGDDDEETDPPREAKSLLSGVLMLHKSDARTRDSAMFGGLTPRKIGETWPVDAQAAEKVYRQNQLDVRAKNISGTVKLLGIEPYNGHECLHVAVDIELAESRPLAATTRPPPDAAAAADNDDDYKVKSESMTSHVEWLIDAAGDEKHFASFSTVRKHKSEGTIRGKHYVMDQVTRAETRIRRLAGSRAASRATTTPTD